MALTSNTQEPSVPITDPTKKKTLGEFIREIPSKVEAFKDWYAEVAKQAAPAEAEWLSQWRQEQTQAIGAQKAQYESELAEEMAEWESKAGSQQWLTQGEFQGYAAAKSYEQARRQEIADWYTEVTGGLDKQAGELRQMEGLQSELQAGSEQISRGIGVISQYAEKGNYQAAQSAIGSVSSLVEKQRAELEQYRDWLREQGTTDEGERARLAEAGLPEEEQITTEDQIREIMRLQEWLTTSATDVEKAIAGPAWSPLKADFWKQRVLGGILGGFDWIHENVEVPYNTLLWQVANVVWATGGEGQLAQLIPGMEAPEMDPKTEAALEHPFWTEAGQKVYEEQVPGASQIALDILNPAWWLVLGIPGTTEGLASIGLKFAAQSGKTATRFTTRFALRGASTQALMAEAGLESRGLRTAAMLAARNPGLVEQALPWASRAIRIGALPVEVPARAALWTGEIAGHTVNAIVGTPIKYAWKGAAAGFKYGVQRPLGRLAVPKSLSFLAKQGGYEISLLSRPEQAGKGMLYRVVNKNAGIDILAKDADEAVRLLNTGKLIPDEVERFYIESTGKIVSKAELESMPQGIGNIWAESIFRASALPQGMSAEVWQKGYNALRLDSMNKMVRPVQMLAEVPTIEKFADVALQETKARRLICNLIDKEWAMGHMRGVPGLRAVIMRINPSSIAKSEVARASVAWRNMQEVLAMWRTARMASARMCQRFEVQVVERALEDGSRVTELICKNVVAKDGKAIPYIGDVLEHPGRFIMSDELATAREVYCAILDEAKIGLQRFGIQINELGFEEGGHYFPRYVLGRNGQLISSKAPSTGGFMTKKAFEKTRIFEEMAEGIQKGYIYMDDPIAILDTHLTAVCNRISDAEFYRLMRPKGLTQNEIVDILAPGLRDRVSALKGIVSRQERIEAIIKIMSSTEARRMPRASTMRMIRRYAPDIADQLLTLPRQATTYERQLSRTLNKALNMLDDMRAEVENLRVGKPVAEGKGVSWGIEDVLPEERIRDAIAFLPDDVARSWKALIDQLYDDAVRTLQGYTDELSRHTLQFRRVPPASGVKPAPLKTEAELRALAGKIEEAQAAVEQLEKIRRVFGEEVVETGERLAQRAAPEAVPAAAPTLGEFKLPGKPEKVVKPTKDWWDNLRLMAKNHVNEAKLEYEGNHKVLQDAIGRAKAGDPFGTEGIFGGETAMRVVTKEGKPIYAFQGTWFPKSTAQEIAAQFGDQGSKILGQAADVNAVARFLMTGMDFGAGMIQGLIVLTSHPDIWAKAQVKVFETFFKNPKSVWQYIARVENQAAIREAMVAGKPIIIGGTEYTTAMGTEGRAGYMARMLRKPVLRRTARPVFERYALAFDTFGNVSRLEMYKALRPICKTAEDIPVLIDYINKATGVTSRKALGIGATQRQIEGAMILFAPRYFQASMALMLDVTRGGMRGALARKAFARMLASGLTMYYGVCLALGQEANLDPRSSKFLTVKVGGSHVGVGSIWVAMARMFADIVTSDPKDLYSVSRHDNPLVKFVSGRLAPLTGSALDVITGKTYVGENLEDEDGFLNRNWAAVGKEVIARNLMPFWLDAQLTEMPKPGWEAIPAEMLGLRSWAIQPWERRNELRDYYALLEYGVTWEELKQGKPKGNESEVWGVLAQRRLEEKYPDLQTVTGQACQDILKRGKEWDLLYDQWTKEFETENGRVSNLLNQAAAEFKANCELRDRLDAGDMTLTQDEVYRAQNAGKVFREKVDQIRDNHRYWREALEQNPMYQEVYQQLDEWKEEGMKSLDSKGLTQYVGDRAYQAYISFMYETTGLQDEYGNFDYEEYDRRKADWLRTWGPEMWDYVQERLAYGKEEPEVVKELRKAREALKAYWELQDKITEKLKGKYPESAEEKKEVVQSEVANRLAKMDPSIAGLYTQDPEFQGSIWGTKGGKVWLGIIAEIQKQVNSDMMVIDTAVERARNAIRLKRPDLDAYLRLFYDRKPVDEGVGYVPLTVQSILARMG